MKYSFSVFCFILFLFSAVNAQEVIYPITNYTTKEYGRDYHPTNMSIIQDQRGIIYAANGFKLLEFDGHSWSSYPINKEAWILSLAVDPSGIIYAGSQNEFGYFVPDPVSGLKYFSLSDSLEIQDMDFSNVWKVSIFSGGVAFQAEEKLFIYQNGKINIIKPETSFHTSFVVNDVLYVRQREIGLMSLQNGILLPEDESGLFKSMGIFLMLPFDKEGREILIGTRESGFYIFDPSLKINRFRSFAIKNQTLIDAAIVNGGVVLHDGNIGLSTVTDGIIIIDRDGNIIKEINRVSGLADNDVKQIIADKDKNLWLSLNNGISTIGYSSPISFYDDKSGLNGSVNTIIRHNGVLYIGTSTGLYVQKSVSSPEFTFSETINLSHPIRSLIEADGSIFAGTDAGLYEIQGNKAEQRAEGESYSLCYSPSMNLLFSGGSKGLSVFIKKGSLKKINLPEEISSDIVAVAERNAGSPDSCEIWIGTRYDGALRLVFRKDLSCKIDKYSSADGLAAGPVIPFSIEKEVIFGTIDGLYKFIHESAVRETLPDSLRNNPDFLRGYFLTFHISPDTIGISFSSLVDSPDKIWICADNRLGYLNKSSYDHFIRTPFMGIDAGKINTIYPDINGICWIGTTDGLVRYDLKSEKDYSSPFTAIIRKVLATRIDSVIYQGVFFTKESSGLKPAILQPDFLKPELSYSNNSLRLDFAATFFENQDKMMFSSRLEGYDNEWTSWEHKYYQEYTNLHEGSYIFHVRAKNVYGQISEEALYSFSISPPWFRSFIAYIIYVLTSIALIWLIIKLYTMRLKRENIRLEGIVMERTAEVVRQRDLLEHQKTEIEDSIRYASRIQSAVLPADQEFTNLVPKSFVFFRPRDIVSGDFYWVSRIDNNLIISAADCTGHGVPGAFMSMLGVAFLDEIVNKDHVTRPELILNKLRGKVIDALQQQGISGEAKDGMDIVVVCIDENAGKLFFAGAYNPLIMIRKGVLSEYRGDRMPIAIFDNMKDFSVHEISVEKGDLFYFSSDGYEDQFGGPEGKKFKSKQFKELLMKIYDKPMKDQKDIIISTFDEWKGDQNQIDDIVVIGVRI
ncbi:MAG: SpoIIE family protein phosphatase [Bacteroidia bacterium]|nr:SpoIIE family protein phosphatase [Bacteroidia bacterium]